MTKEINLIRCTCDVCKQSWDIKPSTTKPLDKVCLPMAYYDEDGRFNKYIVAEIEICNSCKDKMANDLEKHYRLRCVAYGGVTIERKEDENERDFV